MGVLRAGFHGTVGQPSAQVIDGSLKFDRSSNNYLKKTISTIGNQRTFTISGWFKQCRFEDTQYLFTSEYLGSPHEYFELTLSAGYQLQLYNSKSTTVNIKPSALIRDTAWYHIVVAVDTTIASPAEDRVKFYINGERQTDFDTGHSAFPSQDYTFELSDSRDWLIGAAEFSNSIQGHYDGPMSNFYFIDGVTLGPEYFGFTDPLTNTWRPKKFEGPTSPNDGTTWSNSLSGTTNNTIDNPTNLFNNDIKSYADRGTGSSDPMDYTFTPPSTIRANSSIRIHAYAANGHPNNHIKITYNNGVEVTKTASDLGLGQPGDLAWFDLSSYINFPADISSIEYRSISGGGQLGAIEIDGILLIDGFNDPKGFGTNGFYLPMDGNSPISQDKSSRENDWTPVSFGGSNTIEKATGALPILNTVSGGRAATVGVRTDVFANNLVLALPLVDTTTDVSGIINSGTTSKTIAGYENAAPASDGQGNFYDVSLYLDGSNDHVETSNSDDFVVGTGDFTIEAWYNVAATQGTNSRLFAQNVNDDNNWDCYLGGSYGTSDIMMHGGTVDLGMSFPTANAWHHFCIARKNGTLYSFMNGVLRHTQTYTNSVGANNHGFRVGVIGGSGGSTGYGLQGYVQDFRFYKGVAKYTSDFIPASTNPDILPDTPSGVSGGSKLTKITDGAVSFGGSDYLTVPYSSDFVLDGDFTIECFVYFISGSVMVDFSSSGSYANSWQLYNQSPTFAGYSSSGNASMTSDTPLSRGWNHLVVTRTISNNTARMFINGVQTASSTNFSHTYGNDTSNALMVGAQNVSGPTAYFTGYISNLRIIKGTALYTSNFTPPTEPLTNVTNTKLLCCQSNTDVTEGAVKPADVSWIPTGYTYWSGMNDNWNNTGTTTSDLSASSTGDWLDTALPSSGKYYFETIVNDPSQYRVLGISIGQSGAGAGYTDNLFGWYWNGTGTPPLFLTRTSTGDNRSGNSPNPQHGDTSELTLYDGDILMWAWDADNDKIYFGLNGTWYNNGDPAAGTGHIIEGEDLSANSHYLKVGYMNSGGNALNALTLTNVPSSDSGSSSSIVPSREIVNFNLVDKASNFNPFNTDINTVRGQETTYATLNPLATQRSGTLTLSDGNLTATAGATRTSAFANLPFVGKMYYEVTFTIDRAYVFGMASSDDFNTIANTSPNRFIGDSSGSYGFANDGTVYYGGASQLPGGATLESFALNDCMGWAYDTDSGEYSIFKNGRHLGTFKASTSRTYYPAISLINNTATAVVNFGQKPFKFPPPDGYGPVNDANIRPETVIARPDQYVGVTTYSGTALTQSIDHFNFKPDLAWIKVTDNQRSNFLFDSVRGAENYIISDTNGLQVNDSTYLTSFNSNGFTVGTSPDVNRDTSEIVAWCWKAGGGPGITSTSFWKDDKEYASSSAMGLTNGAATIRSASVGTKQGFSIVAYNSTGSSLTLDHGLSQKPDFFIFKCTSHDQHWAVGHSYDYTKELYLGVDGSLQAGSSTTSWGSGPDNNVFTLGTSDYVNTANREYVCYSWHDVPGLQKFGSFTGNGDADGPFIELGFRPAIIWVKRTTTNGYSWVVQDSERQKYNPVGEYLLLNSSNQFGSGFNVDFLSNGFKLRHSNGNMNSSVNYIYCAWAESPAVNLYGGTSNAR